MRIGVVVSLRRESMSRRLAQALKPIAPASFALTQALAGSGALAMPHPEVYLGRIATLFDGEGRLVPDTQEFLRGVLGSFESWCARLAR